MCILTGFFSLDLSFSAFSQVFSFGGFRSPTFSSLVATLKASSVTLPAAQRAALEECSSFQMVSLSTCEQGDRSDGDKGTGQTGTRRGTSRHGTHARGWSPIQGTVEPGHLVRNGASSPAAPPSAPAPHGASPPAPGVGLEGMAAKTLVTFFILFYCLTQHLGLIGITSRAEPEPENSSLF